MILERQELLRDPEKEFATPMHLVECQELSDEDKLKALQNWRLDLIELQQATSENMADANSPPGTTAEKLRQVSEAIETLESRLLEGRK